MKGDKNFIVMVVLSFLVIIGTNPVITYAASSSGGNNFIFYLPMGILIAAVLAGVVNVVERIMHKSK